MWHKFVLVLGCLLHTSSVLSQWSCLLDQDCADVTGSVCTAGSCVCPTGLQLALGGSACVELAPYHTSVCVEDHQCSRLFTSFECRRENDTEEGSCLCQSGFHYFLGRCWPTSTFGSSCTRDEECIDTPRDPYSLTCDGVCGCAQGYYERQRGECRKIGYAVGDGCVLDADCQFTNGVCEIDSRQCVDRTATRAVPTNPTPPIKVTSVNVTAVNLTGVRSHGVACSALAPCAVGFECVFGACVCSVGYYLGDDGLCYAELGSRSTEEQCIGLLAEVVDGICTCPPNFFFEGNMRDCTKVTRRITDSCVTDSNCHTFGVAAYCAPPQDPWQLRNCACNTELAVWDSAREMCRLFAGIGEECAVDSDCLAGELEIQCVSGVCTCPAGLVPSEGLCLTTGLVIGDSCQASLECTGTANTICSGGVCSCGEGYQDIDAVCAPIIGGSCTADSDCVIPDTVCVNETSTCQCRPGLVAYDDVCWTMVTDYEEPCNVSMQCVSVLGENSACVSNQCVCDAGFHHRDGHCWPMTGLFEACSRTSQCYLENYSEMVVCRNSYCQCDFDYPYIEELRTCVDYSSAANIMGSAALIIALTCLVLS